MLSEYLPVDGGVYVLHLHLEQETIISIGSLGEVHFVGGDYLYVGSAFGAGGIKARVGRHIRGEGIIHWHIDALRRVASPVGCCYYIPILNEQDHSLEEGLPFRTYECRWSQALAAMPEMSAPVPGFGASDCLMGCTSHLLMIDLAQISFGFDELIPGLTERLARSIDITASDLTCIPSLSVREGHS